MEDKTKKNENIDFEIFSGLHNLQYERISKLEDQNNHISNFVSGLSTITIAFLFTDKTIDSKPAFYLIIIFIGANILACFYLIQTRRFIKMHQERGEHLRRELSDSVHEIYQNVKKPKIPIIFNRTILMVYLHILIIIAGFVLIFNS